MSNIESRLGNIEGKLDTALDFMQKKQEEQDQRLNNHGTRLAGMENWKSRVLGIAAAAGVVGSLLVKVLL